MASKINVDKIARNSGTPEFTIPTADGTSGQFLKTNGSGVLSFDTVTGTTINNNADNRLISGSATANTLEGETNLTYDGNVLDIKNAGTASSIKVYCESSNAHYTEIKSGPHSGATSYTLTLPNVPPTVSGQALTATTAGVASWASVTQNQPYFYASTSADSTWGSGSYTKIVFNTVIEESNAGSFDTTNNKWVVPTGEGGTYFIGGSFFVPSAVGANYIKMQKDGADIGRENYANQSNGNMSRQPAWIYTFAAGDELTWLLYGGSGTTNGGNVIWGWRLW